MGVVEALSSLSRSARRLLDLAKTWPDSLPSDVPPPAQYRTMRQLRPAEVDELVVAHQAGITVRQLTGQFGIHRSTVGRLLAARGIDTQPPALQPGDILTAADLYRSGWSLERIAQKFGVSDDTVWRRLRDAGVQMRPRKGGKLSTKIIIAGD